MKNGLDRTLQLHDGAKYPRTHPKGGGANNNTIYSAIGKSKHPYLRPDFVFKCCQGKDHKPRKVND